MTIKRLTVRNFKSIRELQLELAPLTILVGPNGSGKSSILEALALMSQSSRRNVYPRSREAIIGGEGALVEYDELNSILHRGLSDVELALGITVDMQVDEMESGIKEDLRASSTEKQSQPLSAYLNLLRELKLDLDKRGVIEVEYVYRESDSYILHSFTIDNYQITFGYDRKKSYYVSEPEWLVPGSDSVAFPQSFTVDNRISNFSRRIVEALKRRLSKVYYLSAERGGIPWSYKVGGVKREWVGRRGEYTMEILAELMKPRYDERRLPYEVLCEMFGVKRVWAGWEQADYLSSNYVDPYLGSSHKLPSLGHGSKQLLSIIAQLAYSEPGSVILVEEPEISLHPSYQRLLPILFGRAVNEGKQVIVTTHSSILPLSLDIILEGYKLEGQTTRGWRSYEVKLSPKDIIVYHVTRDEKEGYTRVEKLGLDERGLKEGIPSFVDVERDILGRLIG